MPKKIKSDQKQTLVKNGAGSNNLNGVYQLPQLKRDQIQFAKKEPSSQNAQVRIVNVNEVAASKMYKSQDTSESAN